MTYPLIIVPFILLTALVVAASARRAGFRRRMVASTLAALALVVLTAIFDNIMIALDLFTYPEAPLSGLRVGAAPLEDFSYPVCAAYGVPAAFALLTPRRSTTTETP